MTIAVVGATGLVGRHVVEALAEAGTGPIVATWHVRNAYPVKNTRWVQCDLCDPDDARRALQGADTAIVCVGQLSTSAALRRDPIESVLYTLRVVTSVLEAAGRLRLSRLVLMSSCTGYPEGQSPATEEDMAHGDPPSQWFGVGWMHRYLEKQVSWYVQHVGLVGSAVVLRPTLLYGPHDNFTNEKGHFVPALVRKVVARARPIDVWGDGTQTRNLLHARDLAAAVVAVLPRAVAPLETFNVASPHDTSVNDTLRHLLEIDGFADATITYDAARGGGPSARAVSSAALTAATGWTPRWGVRQGLADTVAWYRQSLAA